MKRISIIRQAFIALLALVLSAAFISRAAAMPENVDAKVLNHFAKTFKSAENVTWKHTPEYSKATFTRNDKHMEVFYNDNDELICTTTYIDLKELPDATLELVQDKYEGYSPVSAIKCLDASGSLKYYVQLENNKKLIILQADSDGFTTVFKNTKK